MTTSVLASGAATAPCGGAEPRSLDLALGRQSEPVLAQERRGDILRHPDDMTGERRAARNGRDHPDAAIRLDDAAGRGPTVERGVRTTRAEYVADPSP